MSIEHEPKLISSAEATCLLVTIAGIVVVVASLAAWPQ